MEEQKKALQRDRRFERAIKENNYEDDIEPHIYGEPNRYARALRQWAREERFTVVFMADW